MGYLIYCLIQFYAEVASQIAHGKVVGWFNGPMEFGLRALGNRSILAGPRYPIHFKPEDQVSRIVQALCSCRTC